MSTKSIVSGVSTAGLVFAGLVTGGVAWGLALGIGLAMGGVSAAMGSMNEEDGLGSAQVDGGIKLNTRSVEEAIPIIYGELKVGGNDVYIATTGSRKQYTVARPNPFGR